MTESAAALDELRRAVDAHEWYHTLELAPGIETPGYYDLRKALDRIPLPAMLDGMRCLDVGTFDGFWAFEMERRGAREVLALDILDPRAWDWPPGSDEAVVAAIGRRKGSGTGFEVAREALGSSVRRLELSVYDLDPEEHGLFDVVYLGSLLLHLRDPVRALERVRSVCSGSAVICDAVDAPLTELHRRSAVASLDGRGRPWWWKPNLAGLVRMVEAAGFAVVAGETGRLRLPPGRGYPRPQLRLRLLRHREVREEAMRARLGDPHGFVVATPAA